MSTNWVQDIAEMHSKFEVNEAIRKLDPVRLKAYLLFRRDFLQEELDELTDGIDTKDADLVVDSLIDLIVVAIGTLNAFDIEPYEAWDRVHTANMSKSSGVNPTRPNPFGLPDLIKPDNFQSPSHHDNVGLVQKAFE